MHKQLTGVMIVLTLLAFPLQASAYLDPGTGSYFFQILIAVIVGSLFLIKIRFKNIKAYITSMFSKKKKTDGGKK
jgi:hypothetical protein